MFCIGASCKTVAAAGYAETANLALCLASVKPTLSIEWNERIKN